MRTHACARGYREEGPGNGPFLWLKLTYAGVGGTDRWLFWTLSFPGKK